MQLEIGSFGKGYCRLTQGQGWRTEHWITISRRIPKVWGGELRGLSLRRKADGNKGHWTPKRKLVADYARKFRENV